MSTINDYDTGETICDATDAHIAAADQADGGVILIDILDHDVIHPGSWEHQNRQWVRAYVGGDR